MGIEEVIRRAEELEVSQRATDFPKTPEERLREYRERLNAMPDNSKPLNEHLIRKERTGSDARRVSRRRG